mmetsp:Transcript_2443/g.7738  ORF Transcript_2443/g.7738 Transcript_2443/m.7738 type:complete len:270 (+) Transcript_2443:309-1118(+)
MLPRMQPPLCLQVWEAAFLNTRAPQWWETRKFSIARFDTDHPLEPLPLLGGPGELAASSPSLGHHTGTRSPSPPPNKSERQTQSTRARIHPCVKPEAPTAHRAKAHGEHAVAEPPEARAPRRGADQEDLPKGRAPGLGHRRPVGHVRRGAGEGPELRRRRVARRRAHEDDPGPAERRGLSRGARRAGRGPGPLRRRDAPHAEVGPPQPAQGSGEILRTGRVQRAHRRRAPGRRHAELLRRAAAARRPEARQAGVGGGHDGAQVGRGLCR